MKSAPGYTLALVVLFFGLLLIIAIASLFLSQPADAHGCSSIDCPPEPPELFPVFMSMVLNPFWDCGIDDQGNVICGVLPMQDK